MTESDKHEPPKRSTGDIAHSLVRAGVSSIPLVGAAAVELLQILITPPLEKRRDEWMKEVGEALRDLEKNRGVNLEDLRSNDGFVNTVLHASQIALRNSQEEKREALKNAVLHAALPDPPEQSLQQMFLGYVDTFTTWHLRLLKLFDNPQRWAIENKHQFPNLTMGGLSSILESAYPELRGNRSFYDQVWQDLNLRGLASTSSLHSTMTGQGLMDKRTTDMGSRFLRFIGDPFP